MYFILKKSVNIGSKIPYFSKIFEYKPKIKYVIL